MENFRHKINFSVSTSTGRPFHFIMVKALWIFKCEKIIKLQFLFIFFFSYIFLLYVPKEWSIDNQEASYWNLAFRSKLLMQGYLVWPTILFQSKRWNQIEIKQQIYKCINMHPNYKASLVSVHVFSVFLVHCLTHFARYFLYNVHVCIYIFLKVQNVMYLYFFFLFSGFPLFWFLNSRPKKVNCASSKRGQANKRDFDMFPEKCSQFPT